MLREGDVEGDAVEDGIKGRERKRGKIRKRREDKEREER